MPTYTVQHPDGRTFTLDGPTPPTEAELDQIFAAVAKPAAQQTAATPPVAAGAEPPMMMLGRPVKPDVAATLRRMQAQERERTTEGARMMPSVAGLIGGAMGGIPGAAVGGVIGKAVEQTVLRGNQEPGVPTAMKDQAKAIGVEGAIQGVAQGTGEGLAIGAGKLAHWLMNRATTRVTAKLAQEFPELSDTLIDHALTVSQAGYTKAKGLLLMAKSKANAALRVADQAGSVVPIEVTSDLAESFKTALIERAMKNGTALAPKGGPVTLATARLDPTTTALMAKIDQAVQGGAALDATPSLADLFKTQLQKESRALYANRVAPNGPRAMAAEASLKAEFASRLNDAIEAVAKGYKAANAEAKPLIGAVRGIQQATRPSGNLYQAMVRPLIGATIGGAVGASSGQSQAGAVIGGIAATPAMLSREAIVLAHPVVKQLLKRLPQTLVAAIEHSLTGAPAPATAPPPGP